MGFRGVYRGVYSSLIDDEDFQTLTPEARLILLALRICRDAGPAVIFRYYPEVVARQTGLTSTQLEAGLVELAEAGWIERERSVVWVKNGLRYDPTMRLSNAKHLAAVCRAVAGLPKVALKVKFLEYYQITEAFDRLSNGYLIPIPPEDREPNTDTESETRTPNPHSRRDPILDTRSSNQILGSRRPRRPWVVSAPGKAMPSDTYEALLSEIMTREGCDTEQAAAIIAKGNTMPR